LWDGRFQSNATGWCQQLTSCPAPNWKCQSACQRKSFLYHHGPSRCTFALFKR
jgi:hypothetical protein